jgi:hypothetical protein
MWASALMLSDGALAITRTMASNFIHSFWLFSLPPVTPNCGSLKLHVGKTSDSVMVNLDYQLDGELL